MLWNESWCKTLKKTSVTRLIAPAFLIFTASVELQFTISLMSFLSLCLTSASCSVLLSASGGAHFNGATEEYGCCRRRLLPAVRGAADVARRDDGDVLTCCVPGWKESVYWFSVILHPEEILSEIIKFDMLMNILCLYSTPDWTNQVNNNGFNDFSGVSYADFALRSKANLCNYVYTWICAFKCNFNIFT